MHAVGEGFFSKHCQFFRGNCGALTLSHISTNSLQVELYPRWSSISRVRTSRTQPFSGNDSSPVSGNSFVPSRSVPSRRKVGSDKAALLRLADDEVALVRGDAMSPFRWHRIRDTRWKRSPSPRIVDFEDHLSRPIRPRLVVQVNRPYADRTASRQRRGNG